ncbi:hypothetical protein AX17_004767 [Amanita inopinata Kibby_2008]|nr:hypothetical protein AX17_004767 [Amanita inopinata Kibby_2008]
MYGNRETFYAVADGCFRNTVLGDKLKSETRSHFVGVVLEDATLPIPKHGTVALVHGFGPVLLYQISERDTRMLVDVKGHILNNILPQLPPTLHQSIRNALDKDRLQRMPNSFLPPIQQGRSGGKEGVILLGDAWNMRHPLTSGGMTVALHDVVLLREFVSGLDNLSDWNRIRDGLHRWHWHRKPLSSMVNILSVALYDLFGADDTELAILRTGCFKYFERGDECNNGPHCTVTRTTLFYVAFYSILALFTHPWPVSTLPGEKPRLAVTRIDEYPGLLIIFGLRAPSLVPSYGRKSDGGHLKTAGRIQKWSRAQFCLLDWP